MAKISSQTDHNYSLIVRNEPEVEVETVVETTIPFNSNETNILPLPPTTDYQGCKVVGFLNNINVEGTTTSTLSPILSNHRKPDVQKSLEMVVSPNKSQAVPPFQSLQHVKSLGTCFYVNIIGSYASIILPHNRDIVSYFK